MFSESIKLSQNLQQNNCAKASVYSFTKKTLVQVISCELCETFKNTFFAEHLCVTASRVSHFGLIAR